MPGEFDEFTDDDLEDPTPGEDEEESTTEEDPLAALDEATRAAAQARIEAAIAAEKARLEEENRTFRSGYQRRLETARGALQEQFGLDIDADGKPVYRDPRKLNQAALGIVGGGAAFQGGDADDVPAEVKAPIDYTEEPALLQQKLAYRETQLRSQIESEFSKKLDQIQQRLEQVTGIATRPVLSSVGELARQSLEAQGLGHLADHQDFDQALAQSIQAQLPAEQWGDPNAVGAAAALIGFTLRTQAPDRVIQRTAQERAAQRAALNRAGLAATGASRGGGRGAGASQEDLEAAQALGTDLKGLALLAQDPTGRLFADYQEKRGSRR